MYRAEVLQHNLVVTSPSLVVKIVNVALVSLLVIHKHGFECIFEPAAEDTKDLSSEVPSLTTSTEHHMWTLENLKKVPCWLDLHGGS